MILDYFFCEQCQTYHPPNRFVNGQILTACECQVQLQQSNVGRKPTHPSVSIRYSSPTKNNYYPSEYYTSQQFFNGKKVEKPNSNYYENELIQNRKTNEFPFEEILYKSNKPPNSNKQTEFSQRRSEEVTVMRPKKSSKQILESAEPFLKNIPFFQRSDEKTGNFVSRTASKSKEKTIPMLKAVPVSTFSKLRTTQSQKSIYYECTSRDTFNVPEKEEKICCDYQCFYF